MPLPGNGVLSLQGHSRPGDTMHSMLKHAMIVRMSDETLELLEANPTKPIMEFEFGENPGIHIGDTFFPMRPLEERSPHELYLRAPSAAKPMAPLKHYANVTGKFTVGRELGEKIEDKVRDRTLVAQKKRTERTAIYLDKPPELSTTNGKKRKPQPTMFRKPIQLSDRPRPTQNVPATHVQGSPLPTPSTSKEVDNATRVRLIHFLATSTPRTSEEVGKSLGGRDCDPSVRKELLGLLDDVGEPVPSKKGTEKSVKLWQLKPRSWLEVRPYEFPKLSNDERTAMSRMARMAYKSMKIPESNPAWDHIRYRPLPDTTPAVPGPSTEPVKPAKGDPPKRGKMPTDGKEKMAKTKTPKSEVRMKDESVQSTSKIVNGGVKAAKPDDAELKGATSARRLPGSGYKATKPSPASQVQDRELPRPSPPVKTAPPLPPQPTQERKSNVGGVSGAVGRMKKLKESPDSEWERGRHNNVEGEGKKNRERASQPGEDRYREKAKDIDDSVASSASLKRKKPSRGVDEDSGAIPTVQKKRKTDDGAFPTPSSSRESEHPARDLSLPKKPAALPPPRAKTKRETSPPRSLKRESSPQLPSRPKIRRDPSPPPRASTVPHHSKTPSASLSSSSHRRPDHVPDRRTSTKPRRRSIDFTSSEEEEDRPPKPNKSVAPPASRPAPHPRPRPPIPLGADHNTLRERYQSSYVEYIALFSNLLSQKHKIEGLLKGGPGSSGSITDSDGDVDIMDAEELTKLSTEHKLLSDELQLIKQVFVNSGGKELC